MSPVKCCTVSKCVARFCCVLYYNVPRLKYAPQAQRLAAAEAVLRNAGSSGTAASGGGGSAAGDVEGRLRRLAAEVKRLQESIARFGELPGATQVG